MANEIYHKSNWGSPKKDGWGDSYFNPSATNKLYTRSDNYENVEGTDKALASKPDTQSVLMTPTAYSVGSMNSILPTNGDGNFTFDRNSTATRVNKEGLIETVAIDTPRLDYPLIDGVVQDCPSLLLEPARTNLETKSNEFSTWGTINNTTRTADYIISPDGTLNGTRLQFTANGFVANTPQSLATYTVSCYAKRNDIGTQNVGFFTNGSGVVNSAWEITTEWKRFSYTFPALNGGFLGIAGVSGADISVYGFQLEGLVSYPTSYIPTQGSAVTRAAETASGAGTSDDFNDSEGVLYAEIAALANDGTYRAISISDGSYSNTCLFRYGGSSNRTNVLVTSSNSTIFDNNTTSLNILNFNKIVLKYKQNDFSFWVNGFEVATITSGNTPSGLSQLQFADSDNTVSTFYGRTKEVAVFKTALTDSELESLTSWDSFSDMATGQEYSIR